MRGGEAPRVLDWDTIADGRVWRLKRGRHFTGETQDAAAAAKEAARRMGKAVAVVRDEFGKRDYLWVQFVEHDVVAGEPCPACGGLDLELDHPLFAHCPACGAEMLVRPPPRAASEVRLHGAPPPDDANLPVVELGGAKARRGAKARLERFRDVELRRDDDESTPELERYYGHGRERDGSTILLVVEYPLRDGRRVRDPHRSGEDLYRLNGWPIDELRRALELGILPPAGERGGADDHP